MIKHIYNEQTTAYFMLKIRVFYQFNAILSYDMSRHSIILSHEIELYTWINVSGKCNMDTARAIMQDCNKIFGKTWILQ